MHLSFLFSLFLLLLVQSTSSTPTPPTPPIEHLDPTVPPPHTTQIPKCSVLALRHDFPRTIGLPPASVNYTHPTDCPGPWTRVLLELSVTASAFDAQKHRIAAVWIDGVEILRTSTPLPTAPRTFWKVRKDITRYNAALLRLARGSTVTMMLENSNLTLPGVYSVDLIFHFYRGGGLDRFGNAALPTVKGMYREPADLIFPISQETGCTRGYWFTIENGAGIGTATISIPKNTYKAVIEIFSSYHDQDELWYTHPVRSEYDATDSLGAFRQLFATIDGRYVGGHIPLVVVYPGSFNPYLWSPVAAIGAFDMPSYSVDITPFVGLMLDGKEHEIGLGVKGAKSYWLVGGNVHVWVDRWVDEVVGGLVEYKMPMVRLKKRGKWREDGEGESEMNGEGLAKVVGWLRSSRGNLTTMVRQKVSFKSQIEGHNRGTVRKVEMNYEERVSVGVRSGHQTIGRVQLLIEAPLQVQTSVVNTASGAMFERTKIEHQLQETLNLNDNQVVTSTTLTDRQEARGSALVTHDGFSVWGSGHTKSDYKYQDEDACYSRTVTSAGGIIMADNGGRSCLAIVES